MVAGGFGCNEYLTSVDILDLTSGSTFMLETRGTAGSGRVRSHFWNFEVRMGIESENEGFPSPCTSNCRALRVPHCL
jgi:hypothetical protein